MNKISVAQLFHQYLNPTENWAFRLISNTPRTKNTIVSKKFLKTNFYSSDFTYIDFPISHFFPAFVEKNLPIAILNRFIQLVQRAFYLPYVACELRESGVELLHAHFSLVGWEYRTLAKYLKKPLVISFYGFDYESIPYNQPKWVDRYRRLFEEATAFVCEGSYGASVLRQMGCSEEKVHVVKLGVDANLIPFWSRKKAAGELKLLQIATMKEKKGHIYTVQAFARALKTCPDMHLTLVGQDVGDGIIDQISAFIREKRLEEKIEVREWIDFAQLHEFMHDFHVFIHPSCYSASRDCEGGAPIVLLDAQATGLPVISTTHCDIPDEVLDGITGKLVAERDVEALAEAISYFYALPEESYSQFSQRARQHVIDAYDIRKNAQVLRQLYDELLNNMTNYR